MMRYAFKPLSLCLLLSFCASASYGANSSDDEFSLEDLRPLDVRHLQSQKDSIEELVRSKFGARIRGNKSDLHSLQRIIDRGLIDKDDRLKLQAMGAVLGDVFVNENKMEWKVIEDSFGRSRAVCIKDSEHCLYPITMLSRRMQVGLLPRVDKVYNKALSLIEDHFPKNSFNRKPKFPKS